jgi:hypothetical protein
VPVIEQELGFSMPSNSGRVVTKWRVVPTSEADRSLVLETQLQSTFFDRTRDAAEAAVVQDVSIALHQVVSSRQDLHRLKDLLDAWLEGQALFSTSLVESPGQGFRIGLSLRDDVICSSDKPVFEVDYEAGFSVRTQWAYVVDQSCVRIASDELGELLALLEPPRTP